MNIQQLPYILAIASAGNPSAAAKQLGVSQQALSKYLNALEAETGLELFFRSRRRYLPTPAGHLYIRAAQQILEHKRHTVEAIAHMNEKTPASLRLGVSPNRGIETVSRLYAQFNRRYPSVALDISEGYANQLRDMLDQGKLDAVMSTFAGSAPPSLQVLPIHSEEIVLAVPAFHPLVRHNTYHFEELPFAELRDFHDSLFIMPRSSSNLHDLVMEIFRHEDFRPQITESLPNMQLQLAMIRSGTRVGLLPAYYVRPDPEIAFFRLHHSPLLTMVYMTRAGRAYTEAERYLLWLFLRLKCFEDPMGIVWQPVFDQIIEEFGPAETGGVQ